MVDVARRSGRHAWRAIDKFYDQRDEVDFGKVAGYAGVLVEEGRFQPADRTPTEAEVRQLADRLYPAWSRIARGKSLATLLDLLMTRSATNIFQLRTKGWPART